MATLFLLVIFIPTNYIITDVKSRYLYILIYMIKINKNSSTKKRIKHINQTKILVMFSVLFYILILFKSIIILW